jgi:hypothetical protein
LSRKVRLIVMELWNLYIDARLNLAKLFELGYQPIGYIRIAGQKQLKPEGIKGKLLSHISALECCGFSNSYADEIVNEIWNNPTIKLSYEQLLDIAIKRSS